MLGCAELQNMAVSITQNDGLVGLGSLEINHKNSKIYGFALQQQNINATLHAVFFVKVFQHLVTSQMKQEAKHFLNGRR